MKIYFNTCTRNVELVGKSWWNWISVTNELNRILPCGLISPKIRNRTERLLISLLRTSHEDKFTIAECLYACLRFFTPFLLFTAYFKVIMLRSKFTYIEQKHTLSCQFLWCHNLYGVLLVPQLIFFRCYILNAHNCFLSLFQV